MKAPLHRPDRQREQPLHLQRIPSNNGRIAINWTISDMSGEAITGFDATRPSLPVLI
jgi:hypothetical protein